MSELIFMLNLLLFTYSCDVVKYYSVIKKPISFEQKIKCVIYLFKQI